MRAAEVLNRYANGERNFQNVNLRRQKFHNQDLSGADFSRADLSGSNFTNSKLQGSNFSNANLRGTNFSNATLQKANLSYVQCGLQQYWLFLFWIATLLASAYVGFSSDAFTVKFSGEPIISTTTNLNVWPLLSLAIVLLGLFLVQAPKRFLWKDTVVFFLISILVPGILLFLNIKELLAPLLGAILVASLFYTICAEVGLKKYRIIGFLTIFLVILLCVLLYHFEIIQTDQSWLTSTVLPIVFGLAFNEVGGNKDSSSFLKEFSFLFSIAPGVGTNFHAANLTDTNLTGANVIHSNFLNSVIDGTCWFQVKGLEYTRSSSPLVMDSLLRKLVTTGNGQGQNFDNKDLRGAYLKGANLAKSSCEGADLRQARLTSANLRDSKLSQTQLNQADLREADLTGAELVQSQLADADLTAAILTAACIEDWNITTRTILDRVSCRFVFMRQVKQDSHENSRRKPDDWNQDFADGDFTDFIKPLTDTLDLYHNGDVDPRAIAISFKKLSDDNPDANLQIVAMESRGTDKFMLRATTTEDADKSELNHQYTQTYKEVRSLPSDQQWQRLMAEKDNRIQSLEKFLEQAIGRPNFLTIEQKQGDYMPAPDNSIQVGGDMIGNTIGNDNTVDIQIQQADLPQPQSVNIAQELDALKQILTQLQSEDKQKIENAISDAQDELKKSKPDKDEVGQALGRALDYAQKTQGFAESIDKLRPHVANAAGWLGKNWYKLLAIVGLAA